jgi:hypothetical protein
VIAQSERECSLETSGVLHIEGSQSKVDGTLLATQGSSNPFGDATSFLQGTCHLRDGNSIIVEGDQGKVGTEDVIFVTNARRSPTLVSVVPTETESLVSMSTMKMLAAQPRKTAAPRKKAAGAKLTKAVATKSPPKAVKKPAVVAPKPKAAAKKKLAAKSKAPRGKR